MQRKKMVKPKIILKEIENIKDVASAASGCAWICSDDVTTGCSLSAGGR